MRETTAPVTQLEAWVGWASSDACRRAEQQLEWCRGDAVQALDDILRSARAFW